MSKTHLPIPCPPHPTYDIKGVINAALEEDAGGVGDVTTLATISTETKAKATFLAKADGVVAGLGVVDLVFELVDKDLEVKWFVKDGDRVKPGLILGEVFGSARGILVAERVALNFMQRMSGVATATAAMVAAAASSGSKTKVLETRKTVPGLRLLDKWAVLIGGGYNHRLGLYDMMMIKDNHIAAAGGITAAVERAEAYIAGQNLGNMPIEVETRTMEELDEILNILKASRNPDGSSSSHVTRVMLDNMTKKDASASDGIDVSMLEVAVKKIDGLVDSEASGNVTLATVKKIAATGVTFVSVGALTHSVMALDISLNVETQA
uniref:Nicotinate-nucleotide pyrophosphorylase [carboxylating] n=1 Tax=Polytomella parva TaxID=51329 RepID=A0A7S0USH4_9CHLO|mmetsp:Transcript_13204/g.23415  ORF Transcript_13204/g.23415 Transcript_13204/m.23415 type:complete len:323 (+) Transcript_13204:31-999(+)